MPHQQYKGIQIPNSSRSHLPDNLGPVSTSTCGRQPAAALSVRKLSKPVLRHGRLQERSSRPVSCTAAYVTKLTGRPWRTGSEQRDDGGRAYVVGRKDAVIQYVLARRSVSYNW